ncbi:2-oxo-4-hydroxy-4-carboxy-5-ureidoimidazoline decarboxylase [Streptomyces stramineus]
MRRYGGGPVRRLPRLSPDLPARRSTRARHSTFRPVPGCFGPETAAPAGSLPRRSPKETPLHGPERHGLDRLNSAAPGAAEAALLACCGSRRWARHLAAHRPYPDLGTLLAAADRALRGLAPAELAEALADETGPAALASHPVLRRAHAAYESRFGHVFVLCPDGPGTGSGAGPPARVLAALRARLSRTVAEEAAVTAAELARLALGLARLASDTPCTRDHALPGPHGG